ncbi:hypothetical protein Tco_1545030 [Tanacetum coccineum]
MEELHNNQSGLGEGSGNPTEPQHTSKLLHYLIVNKSLFPHYLNLKRLKNLGKPKRATKISQSSGPIPLVADETIINKWENRMERAATIAYSLEAEQDSVNTLGSGEDSMKLKELMKLCTKLPERILDNKNRQSV